MIASIKQWFAPPIFEGDEAKTRRARLLNAILSATLIYLLLVILIELFDGRIPRSVISLNGIGVLLALILRYRLRRGKISFVGYGLSIVTFIWTTLVSANMGTVRTPTTASYVFIVILAGVLFDWRGILVSTVASSLAVLGLILAENAGLLIQPDYTVTFTQWFTYTGLFGITGGMVYFTLETTQKALVRAENEIKDREHAEMELRASEIRYRSLFEQTHDAVFILDLKGHHLEANQRAADILGYTAKEMKTLSINETSAEKEKSLEIIKRLVAEEYIPTYERLFRKKDGQILFTEVNAELVRDSLGNPLHIQSVVRDISRRKQAEEKLLRQNEYLSNLHQITLDLLGRQKTQTLLNNIVQYAMLLVDAHHGYIFLPDGDSLVLSAATQGFIHNIGNREPKPGKGVLGRVWQTKEIFIVENYSEWEFRDTAYDHENLRAVAGIPIKTGSNIIGVLEVVNTKSPRIFTHEELKILTRFALLTALVLDNAQLLDSAKHEIAERTRKELILQTHVSEIEQLQMELREQALRDPLTGLYNRRYLGEAIEREILSAKRDNIPLSVIVTDIDHFKAINDTCGHQVGDTFLLAIANILKTNSRSSDIVCRFGGEEFLMVLPGTPLEAAVKRAEEIREKCMQIAIYHEGKTLQATMSFGVATYPDHGWEAEEIIIKADKGLYKSKENGRNLVTVWSE